jgi:hypothetical protein
MRVFGEGVSRARARARVTPSPFCRRHYQEKLMLRASARFKTWEGGGKCTDRSRDIVAEIIFSSQPVASSA